MFAYISFLLDLSPHPHPTSLGHHRAPKNSQAVQLQETGLTSDNSLEHQRSSFLWSWPVITTYQSEDLSALRGHQETPHILPPQGDVLGSGFLHWVGQTPVTFCLPFCDPNIRNHATFNISPWYNLPALTLFLLVS